MSTAISDVQLSGLRLFRRGKVRDSFDLGDKLLIVASDRISAYDVILPDAIPDKGRVLTKLSAFWFEHTRHIAPNHLISVDIGDLPNAVGSDTVRELLRDRFMFVHKAERIDFECVMRGYLSGSAWAEYQERGTVCGAPLPAGLVESDRLAEPIFTPATKAESGHDLNVSIQEMRDVLGAELTDAAIKTSVALYSFAAAFARERGVIIADTKFELGLLDGRLIVIDEILTPDSSRFWDAARYAPGRAQASFDKQYVRDWLNDTGWDRTAPAPPLPADVIEGTSQRYREAYERITGTELDAA
jgi:phosphoribosylaminoimidazole-succinocarboxamide synthase